MWNKIKVPFNGPFYSLGAFILAAVQCRAIVAAALIEIATNPSRCPQPLLVLVRYERVGHDVVHHTVRDKSAITINFFFAPNRINFKLHGKDITFIL